MAERRDVDLRIWGKSRGLSVPYPLICHLLDTAAVTGALWDRYLAPGVHRFLAAEMGVEEEQARRLVVLWAGLHDVGKAIPCFQTQNEDAFKALDGYPTPSGEWRSHGFAAHVWLATGLRELGYGGTYGSALRVAQMLGGHHGRFSPHPDGLDHPLLIVPELGDGAWEEQRRALLGAVHRIVGAPASLRSVKPVGAAIACGVVILSDWLASQDAFLRERLPDVPVEGDLASLTAHYERGVRMAPELLRQAGLGRLRLKEGGFVEEFSFAPNGLQRSIETELPGLVSDGPGLLLITAPTGDGKTEAALHGGRLLGQAAGTPGFFVGLPTMATADHMYIRVDEYGRRRAEGDGALTLLHSMAWLNSAYLPEVEETEVITSGDDGSRLEPTEWLRGAKRGLLASLTVATIDQALVAALSGRHNMLRMLGLAGKVFVVDEVHAYDAYMQGLLRRLLTWLGRMGVPVVLLSATLPRHVARRLVESYLAGAGHRPSGGIEKVNYPGWLYADAGSGRVHSMTVEARSRRLAIDLHDVPSRSEQGPDRSEALRGLLRPLVDSRQGCAAVICNTVGEAQRTYRELAAWFAEIERSGGRAPDLDLLHARFPAVRREEITLNVVARYGKTGAEAGLRSRPGVLIATQVIEQSIDLDFDLMISDLAPVALLLQRAGRCHRHEHNPRPDWSTEARLAVLNPVDDKGKAVIPVVWPYVYPTSLLRRTRDLLERRGDEPIHIPEQVQGLIDEVYDEETFRDDRLDADDMERLAEDQVRASLANMVAIPKPKELRSLHELTERDLDEKMFRTRLGADSARVVCCYRDADGGLWLEPTSSTRLPVKPGPEGNGRFSRADVKTILGHTIPVPATWVTDRTEDHAPPPAWEKNPYLRDLVLLPHPLDQDGTVHAVRLGSRRFKLHEEEGLTDEG